MKNARGKEESMRIFEITMIVLFVCVAAVWGTLNGLSAPVEMPTTNANIQAYAYALPQEGWAPLRIYFSAFGTQDLHSEIIRYEWDLDGNGAFETDATANGGYASYVYTKSRTYTISLRVTNTKGGTAIAQTQVHVKHPTSSSVDYWSVFDDSRVRKITVQIKGSDWDRMIAAADQKLMVPADAIIFGEQVEQIGISPKGNSTLWFPGDKKPFKLDMNAYLPEQEYKNLKMLLLHNNFGDPSMLREKVAYDMMRFAGVPAGHTAYVTLWLDIVDDDQEADFIGVYTMVERPDTKFLANRFGRENDRGNLYKADAWFEEGAADLAYYGEHIENYPKPRGEIAYALMYQDASEHDYADIIQLCYVIDGVEYASPEEFAAALEQVFDVDVYLRYLAVIFLSLNFDQYPDTGNNYYLYHNPGNDKFEWIAWDMGNSWGLFGGDATYPIFGTEQSMGPLQYRPLFTKVFQVESYRQTYQAYLDLLIRHWFNQEMMSVRAQGWHDLVRPSLSEGNGDKMYFGESAQYHLETFDSSWQEIVDLTHRRAEYVKDVLQSK
jgi:spore coat protein CotH